MKKFKYVLLSLIFLLIADVLYAVSSQRADLVIINGNIYTMDEKQPTAEMIAVKDGRIVYVGENTGIRTGLILNSN